MIRVRVASVKLIEHAESSLSLLVGSLLMVACTIFSIGQVQAKTQEVKSADAGIRLAKFDIDVTPPIGFAMAYDRVRRVD